MEEFIGNCRSSSRWRYLTHNIQVGTPSAIRKYKVPNMKKIEYQKLLIKIRRILIDLLRNLRWTPPSSSSTTSTKRIRPSPSSQSSSSGWRISSCTFCWVSTRTLTTTSFSTPWIWLIAFEVYHLELSVYFSNNLSPAWPLSTKVPLPKLSKQKKSRSSSKLGRSFFNRLSSRRWWLWPHCPPPSLLKVVCDYENSVTISIKRGREPCPVPSSGSGTAPEAISSRYPRWGASVYFWKGSQRTL